MGTTTGEERASKAGPKENTNLMEPPEFGEPVKYDPTFNGPIKNRSCTDVICCILFVVFLTGSVGVAFFAYTSGNPYLLIYPTDSFGQLCGTGKYQNKSNLFFFDLSVCAKMGPAVVLQGCPTPQICTSSCPSSTWSVVEVIMQEKLSKPSLKRNQMICQYGVNPYTDPEYKNQDVWNLIEEDICAPYYVESKPFVGRCIPAIFHDALTAVSTVAIESVTSDGNFTLKGKDNSTVTGKVMADASQYLAQFLSAVEIGKAALADVLASWYMIVIALVLSAVISLIWLLLMRWIAGVMVWISLALFIVLFAFLTYYCFDKYVLMKNLPEASGNFVFTTNLQYYLTLKDTWLAFGIIVAIVLAVTVILMIFLRSRILIAIALIKEASKAISNMILILLWPIFPFVLHILVLAYFLSVAVYLSASSKMAGNNPVNGTNTTTNASWAFPPCQVDISNITDKLGNATELVQTACRFLKYEVYGYVDYLQAYNLFIFFWLFNFVDALCQMTLAGAFASYYWAFVKPKDIPAFPVIASFWRCFRYHLGSLAFGSLLIAIVQMIRVLLEYIDRKTKGVDNPVAKFIMKCMKCCFWCLEKFLKFINKNAYILIAVYGKNFCVSAKNAFFLLMRNIVRVVVVDKITAFCLFIAKLVVVGGTVTASYFFFNGSISFLKDYTPTLNYFFVPVIIIGLMSYIIASAFFSVYSMGVDTLFLCFLEDLERHDGSEEKPYYMSRELMGILDKENKGKADK